MFRAVAIRVSGPHGVLHSYFDVFNLFNTNTVTEFDGDLGAVLPRDHRYPAAASDPYRGRSGLFWSLSLAR